MFFRPLAILLSLSVFATAAPAKKRPAPVAAVPAVPAQPGVAPDKLTPRPALIDSEINGRDLLFIAHAIDLGKALRYLATQTARTSNPALRGFGDDLVKTLAAQSAVLNTVAEMRKLKVPEVESSTEKSLSAKLANLEGAKLEKSILNAFMDVDRRVIAVYQLAEKSEDQTIRKFVEQTLPTAKEHLILVNAMAGISTPRPANPPAAPAAAVAAPDKPVAPPAAVPARTADPVPVTAPNSPRKPVFRSGVTLPPEQPAPAKP